MSVGWKVEVAVSKALTFPVNILPMMRKLLGHLLAALRLTRPQEYLNLE